MSLRAFTEGVAISVGQVALLEEIATSITSFLPRDDSHPDLTKWNRYKRLPPTPNACMVGRPLSTFALVRIIARPAYVLGVSIHIRRSWPVHGVDDHPR